MHPARHFFPLRNWVLAFVQETQSSTTTMGFKRGGKNSNYLVQTLQIHRRLQWLPNMDLLLFLDVSWDGLLGSALLLIVMMRVVFLTVDG